MLCVFISSDVATAIVKPQYRHVTIRSSWLGFVGAPHLVHDVGITFFGGGALIVVGVGCIVGGIGPDGTLGMGTGDGVGVTGVVACGGVTATCIGFFASTSGLPPTAMIPLSAHVLSSRCPSFLSPWYVGPSPFGIVMLNWYS
jgi:hypothetical protein